MQFYMVYPIGVHRRLNALWSRLVESGIVAHLERRHTELYKAIRHDWIRSLGIERDDGGRSAIEVVVDEGATGIGAELQLFLMVLTIGHSMATLALAVEVFGASRWRRNHGVKRGVADFWRWLRRIVLRFKAMCCRQ